MVKFKCNQTGNVFNFFAEHDIKTMRTHPDYSEVRDEEQPGNAEVLVSNTTTAQLKRPSHKNSPKSNR